MGFQVFFQFVLGAEKIVIAAVPVRDVQIALVRIDGPLLETFSKPIRTLPEDFLPQIRHLVRREQLLEVAVDPPQEPAVYFLHRPNSRHELGCYARVH